MSDEAFARRFYSDRAELTALGVPLTSQRDEFTGEELYTLRSENYFLDRLELDDDELAALQTALYLLENSFAYAEPLRLALQNLVLGRPGFRDAPTATAERVRVTSPDYSPELAGRLSKLENAIAKQRTITFSYWSPSRDRVSERMLNPFALRLDEGVWYVVGNDLDRAAIRTFRVSRIRSDIRFATRRERDFRLPADFDVEAHRVPKPWQIGDSWARRGSQYRRTPHGGSSARFRMRARSTRASSRRGTRSSSRLPAGFCARTAELSRSSQKSFARPSRKVYENCAKCTMANRRRSDESGAPTVGRRLWSDPPDLSHPSGSGCCRHCSPISSQHAATGATQIWTESRWHSGSRFRSKSCRITCPCSTSSTSEAAATRSTPSSPRTPGACGSTRSCTATCSDARRS